MNDDTNKVIEPSEEVSDQEIAPETALKCRLERTLPTARLAFNKQVDILKAYPAAYERVRGPVSIDDLKDFVRLAPATISQANPFITEVGVVQKEGRKFVPSHELQSMLRLSGISQDKAWAKLAPLFEESWFGQLLIPKLKYRPMTEDEIVHDLADAARAEADHIPQLRMIVDYLLLVGLVTRDGGVYKLVNHVTPPVEERSPKGHEAEKPAGPPVPNYQEEGLEQYSLTLDPKSKKRIVLFAPPTVTSRELDRIQKWLSFQLIVEGEETGPGGT